MTHRSMPDHDQWPAFALPWDDSLTGPTDRSRLLAKPAGAEDTPIAQSERLLLPTGARVAHIGMRWRDDSRQSLGD